MLKALVIAIFVFPVVVAAVLWFTVWAERTIATGDRVPPRAAH